MISRINANRILAFAFTAVSTFTLGAQTAHPALEKYNLLPAPETSALLLKKGDRLAICGDSITEQKMYSRMIETYLTVCVPDLNVTVRQYGWSGERADGFLRRMTNDVLRFQPTIATTCYGMNDHEYKPYEDRIGNAYSNNTLGVIKGFKGANVRLVVGSAGTVGKMPSWVKSATGTVEDLNMNLARLRNIDVELAKAENVTFADVFSPMVVSGDEGQKRFGPDFMISGKDGVHPGFAGQTVMAYAYLRALGLDGNLGTITVDLKSGTATAENGHQVVESKPGTVTIKSTRYPYCATGNPNTDDSIRAAMVLIPFNEKLNRLTLVAKGGSAAKYKVVWGKKSLAYSAEELAKGINLAADFAVNPFSEAFAKVEAAVLAKQTYETRQIKELVHKDEGRADMEGTFSVTEKARAPLAAAIRSSFAPVTHTLQIVAE
ncbi:MAG TPA: SGNH/GDSL hydrolase family protein [Roseimicrobium sp.]|nr:SGNH/GDSL hydrolase family protein [Roseimicrobium sp.]